MCDINAAMSRRKFVEMSSLAVGSVAFSMSPRLLAEDVARRETADLIVGPFYPQLKPRDTDVDLTAIRGHRQRAAGQVVQLSGRVMNLRGEPVRNARVEIWQANTSGVTRTHPTRIHSWRWIPTSRDMQRCVPTATVGTLSIP